MHVGPAWQADVIQLKKWRKLRWSPLKLILQNMHVYEKYEILKA